MDYYLISAIGIHGLLIAILNIGKVFLKKDIGGNILDKLYKTVKFIDNNLISNRMSLIYMMIILFSALTLPYFVYQYFFKTPITLSIYLFFLGITAAIFFISNMIRVSIEKSQGYFIGSFKGKLTTFLALGLILVFLFFLDATSDEQKYTLTILALLILPFFMYYLFLFLVFLFVGLVAAISDTVKFMIRFSTEISAVLGLIIAALSFFLSI